MKMLRTNPIRYSSTLFETHYLNEMTDLLKHYSCNLIWKIYMHFYFQILSALGERLQVW